MSTPTCEAKLPSACRVHGLGQSLPDAVFDSINVSINRQLDRSAAYKRRVAGADDTRFNALQDAFAATLWQQAIKTYRYQHKLTGYRDLQLPSIPVHTPRDAIHNSAVALFNAAGDVDFLSHRSETLPFKAVANHVKAKNNCSRVSQLLVRQYAGTDLGFDTPARTIRVDAPDSLKPGMVWHHAAVTGERDGIPYVVDYTLNQFDRTVPVPYVADRATWLAKLDSITGETWSTTHLGQWDIQGDETRADLISATVG